MGVILLLLCFCLCLMPQYAGAASTTDAKEPIVTDRECTLTMSYSYDEAAFADQTVMLYHIADLSADFQYTLTQPFVPSDLILNGIQTNGEWNVIRSTLESYILANDIVPTATAITDESGKVCYLGLKPGLYLASAVTVVQDTFTCFFDSALVSLPGLGVNGLWEYSVAVSAKPAVLPPIEPDETIQFRVVKLWKGDTGRTDRPKSIEVEIFRDGIHHETVVLSEENHWSYNWETKDDGATWNVIERNVPIGYNMTVEQRDTVFVLTNTRIPDDPEKPDTPSKTGDTTNILLYAVIMYVSGTGLILLGILGKRYRHEKTN